MTGYRVERQADGVPAVLPGSDTARPRANFLTLLEAYRHAQKLAGWTSA